jgi:hypothetical protein
MRPAMAKRNWRREVTQNRAWHRRQTVRTEGTTSVVEFNPGIQAGTQFGSRFEGIQINALVFQRSPQSFNEHIVQPATASVHRYANFLRQQQAGELRAGELTSLSVLNISGLP